MLRNESMGFIEIVQEYLSQDEEQYELSLV
jgi:hypothetical protein